MVEKNPIVGSSELEIETQRTKQAIIAERSARFKMKVLLTLALWVIVAALVVVFLLVKPEILVGFWWVFLIALAGGTAYIGEM